MNKICTLLFLLAITLTMTLTIGAKAAVAQGSSPIDLSVSPPVTYYQIEPGQKKTITIILQQKGSSDLEITPSLVDFTSDGKTGQPVIGTASEFRYLSLSLPKNTTPSPGGSSSSFILEPGIKKNVQVSLDIPSDAIEGEYPLTLLFRAKPKTTEYAVNSGSEISAIVGSNLIVLISPTDRDRSNITLEEIKTIKVIDSFMPISFSLWAKNIGKNATTASGSAQIKNWQDTTIKEFPIYPDMVLAQSTRKLRTTPSIAESLEDPSSITDQFIHRPNFAFGPYTITATLEKNKNTANQTTETIVVTQTIFALPFSLLILVLISIAVWVIFNYLSTNNSFLNAPENHLRETRD